MEFKIGQILNFKNYDGWFMKLEVWGNQRRFGTKGYTHSAIITRMGKMPDGVTPGVFVCEADGKKISGSWYEQWWLNNKFESGELAIGTPNVIPKDLTARCEKHIGEPYDWGDIIDIAKYWLTGVRDVRNANDDTWICSEYVATMLYPENDIIKENGQPLCYDAPMDLFLSKLYNWEVKNG